MVSFVGLPGKMRVEAHRLWGVLAWALVLMACGIGSSAVAQPQHPYKYDVEYVDGRTELGVWMHYDSAHGTNEFWSSDTAQVRDLHKNDVKHIFSIADPIHPPEELEWDAYKDGPFSPWNPDSCDCMGHERSTTFHLLDAKLGLGFKGKSTYNQVTPAGPVAQQSVFFNPFNKGGTQLDIEAGAAAGWRVKHWDLGLQLEVIPTDGFFFFPLSLHTRYYFTNDCCAWNLFLNAGIPFDFQTGAPIFITPLFDKRQRRYLSIGVGKLWPLSGSKDLAIDLGYRYMVIPLDQIQCCPTIEFQNRFPARESQSLFLQVGYAF